MSQKGFAHIFLILILLGGIIGGVYLVTSGNPLKIFSRASDKPIIEVTDEQGKALPIDSEKGMVVIKKPLVNLALHPPIKQKDNVIKSNTSLFQALLDSSGKNLISRRCNVSDGKVEWDKCTEWVNAETESIRASEGFSEQKYRSFDSFVLEDVKPVVYQSLVAESGEEGYARNCLINPDSFGVVLDNCSRWSTVDFRNLRNQGNEKYRSLNSYLIKESGNSVLKQSLVSESGQEGYARSCPIRTNGSYEVDWDNCSSWQTVDFTNLKGEGNESYSSVSSFVITNKNGESILNQSLLDNLGTKGLARTCPIKNEGIIWSECSGWQIVNLGSLRNPELGGGESYLSIANFPITFKEEIISPKIEFIRFKITENKDDFAKLSAAAVENNDKTTSYFFSDLKPGKRTLFVKLFYSDGSTIDSSLDLYLATDDLYYLLPKAINPKVNGEYDGGKVVYFDVDGKTPSELMADMTAKGRGFVGGHVLLWAATTYSYRWSWPGPCTPTVEVEISFAMPRWVGYSQAPEAFKKQWNKFYQSLDEHERGHAVIANSGAEAIKSALINSSCNNEAAYAVYYQAVAQQREYDKNTRWSWEP